MKILLTLFALLLFNTAQAEEYGSYQAEILRVIDGDTIEVRAHIWIGLTKTIKLRLAGINTPENKGKGISACEKKAGQDATTFTQRWLNGAGMVTISEVRNGKYAGRVLGKISKNSKYLGEDLIKAGLAKPYHGGKRAPWC